MSVEFREGINQGTQRVPAEAGSNVQRRRHVRYIVVVVGGRGCREIVARVVSGEPLKKWSVQGQLFVMSV